MAKADIDWGNLGFEYRSLPQRYIANYADGKWDAGGLFGVRGHPAVLPGGL